MWPTGGSSGDRHPNDVDRTSIYGNVPINVRSLAWPHFYAQVRYFVYLYVDSNGRLQGNVDYWDTMSRAA
jgi:hypothetical protein